MGRKSRKRPWNQPYRPLDVTRLNGMRRTELGPGQEDYHVQQISSASKDYRCPGCSQLVLTGTSHVVVWRTESIFGTVANLEARRHWHSNCWNRRLRPN